MPSQDCLIWLKAGGYDLSALALGMFLENTQKQILITTMVVYDGNLLNMMLQRPIGGTFMLIVFAVIIYLVGRGVYNLKEEWPQQSYKKIEFIILPGENPEKI